MLRALGFLIFAPFWVHFLLAGGFVGGGYFIQQTSTAAYVEKERLANSAPPAMVAIDDFKSDAPRHLPVEMNLRAQVAIKHNVNLVKTKNGKTIGERVMYILTAPDADADANVAYGAVILYPNQIDTFASWVALKILMGGEEGALGPVLTLDGLRDDPSDKSHIMKALGAQGFVAAPDFMYVRPFLEGRAAALALTEDDKPHGLKVSLQIALGFVLFGLAKLVLSRLRPKLPKRAKAPVAAKTMPATTPFIPPVPNVATSIATAPVAALSSNDFIGALSRKKEMATQAVVPPPIVTTRSLSERFGGLGGIVKKAKMLAIGLVLYFGLMQVTPGLKTTSLAGSKNAGVAVVEMVPFTTTADQVTAAPEGLPAQAPAIAQGPSLVAPVGPAPVLEPVTATQSTAPLIAPEGQTGSDWSVTVLAKLDAIFRLGKDMLAAPPLWLMMSVLASVILLPAVFLLKRMSYGAAKKPDFDPFERLMQRRLAEAAREQKMGGGFQRA